MKRDNTLIVGLAILIIVLALLNTELAWENMSAKAATATFGNTAIGSLVNGFSTDKDASRFLLNENGIIQSITVYFANKGFYAKTAIYADSSGSPAQLLSQSSSQLIGSTGWITFDIPDVSIIKGYYWLTTIADNSIAKGTMVAASQKSHAWRYTAYSTEFSSTFGIPSGYGATATSIYATYSPTLATATFGNTAIGSLVNGFSTDKDASRFWLKENGIIQGITAYFADIGFSAKTAIYTDNNGAPGILLVQSGSQTISSIGWKNFVVTQTTLNAGYYWLTVVSNNNVAQGRMQSSTANNHAWRYATYSGEFTASFGTPNGRQNTATSIYATYTPTVSTSLQTQPIFTVYWDQGCTNKVSSITWGALSAGTVKNLIVYVRNEGNNPITLACSASNWNPISAAAYMTLTWDYANQQLSAGAVVKITLKLTVSNSINSINSFSFDTSITAAG